MTILKKMKTHQKELETNQDVIDNLIENRRKDLLDLNAEWKKKTEELVAEMLSTSYLNGEIFDFDIKEIAKKYNINIK